MHALVLSHRYRILLPFTPGWPVSTGGLAIENAFDRMPPSIKIRLNLDVRPS